VIVGTGIGGSNGTPGFNIPFGRTVLKSPSVVGIGPQTFTGEFFFAGSQTSGLTLGYYSIGFGTGVVTTSSTQDTTATGYGVYAGLSIPVPSRIRDAAIQGGTRVKNKAVEGFRRLFQR
jgi:hypothetical protein